MMPLQATGKYVQGLTIYEYVKRRPSIEPRALASRRRGEARAAAAQGPTYFLLEETH